MKRNNTVMEVSAINNKSKRWVVNIGEIITNPVPFNAIMGSSKFDAGLSETMHRYIPGHDPLLGYLVGTMNILASTITGLNYESFHSCTGETKNGGHRDCLSYRADNAKILSYTEKRVFYGGI